MIGLIDMCYAALTEDGSMKAALNRRFERHIQGTIDERMVPRGTASEIFVGVLE